MDGNLSNQVLGSIDTNEGQNTFLSAVNEVLTGGLLQGNIDLNGYKIINSNTMP